MFVYAYKADPKADSVSINDYDWLQTLGTGAYGKVDLAMNSSNGKFYAIKCMEKERVSLTTLLCLLNVNLILLIIWLWLYQ